MKLKTGKEKTKSVLQQSVIQEQNTQSEAEQIEETVIASELDQRHEDHEHESGEMPQRWRANDQERHNQFDKKHYDCGKFMKRSGQLMGMPGQRSRERLRFVVVAKRRQFSPGRIGAAELHHA